MLNQNNPTSGKENVKVFGNKHFKVTCEFKENGRLAKKTEQSPFFTHHYIYVYDFKDHLERVLLNGEIVEDYSYTNQGQRVMQYSSHNPPPLYLRYNPQNQLLARENTAWIYDKNGAVSKKMVNSLYGTGGNQTKYFYDGDTRLDKVILPNGDVIKYTYGKGKGLAAQNPVAKYFNNKLAVEYIWADELRLGLCRDYQQNLKFTFKYAQRVCPEQVIISRMGNREKGQVTALCGCDQAGSLKLLTSTSGKLFKHIHFDSFGNALKDSDPTFHLPIGFAGGLTDKDTGLVRFGYRDYDSDMGRFLCPDPLGFGGVDNDLYDYCMDDPVSLVDSNGLFPMALIPLIALGIKGAGLGIGLGGTLGTSAAFDAARPKEEGAEPWKATKDVRNVKYKTALASLASFAPIYARYAHPIVKIALFSAKNIPGDTRIQEKQRQHD